VKIDSKGLLVLAGVVLFLIVGAYMLGVSSTNAVSSNNIHLVAPATNALQSNSLPATQSLPSSHPSIPNMNDGGFFKKPRKFNHFRVGNRNVKGMAASGDKVWVGTSGGIIRYDLKSDDYKLFDVSNGSLLSNGVFHVSMLDGKVVVGTYGGGMSIHDPVKNTWKNYNIPDGLADQFVYDVQKVKDGDVWIATWSGVNQVKNGALDDPTKWTTFNVENTNGGLPNDWVYGLEQSPDGAMWFATENGIARYNKGEWKNWQHAQGLGAPLELVKDDIHFRNDPGKASRHHARQKQEQGLENANIAYNPNYVVSLKIDKDGIVWGGTWGGGLARFDGKEWRNFTVKDGLPSNHVFMLYMDDDGTVWAGTSDGLAKINSDKQSFTVLKRKDGLYSDNVFSMSRATDGSLWVGSFGGVARLYGKI
jgi:ligand-binding sensor domain-containing protein